MNRPPKRRNKKPFIIILILFLILALLYILLAKPFDNKADDSQTGSRASTNTGTRDASSEGSTFPVPDDVPAGAIKDYTLIVEEERFKIRRDGESNRYLITLYAIINRPDQYDSYRDQLREYKQAALQYLKDKGVDVKNLEVTYEPTEAAQL